MLRHLVLTLAALGCGKDPILERVEAMERAEEKAAVGTPGKPVGDEQLAGEEVVPVVPEAPEPGIPEAPEPGIPVEPGAAAEGSEVVARPGVASAREEGEENLTPGVAEAPEPGVPEEPTPGVPEDPTPAPPGSPVPSWAGDTGQAGAVPNLEPGIPEEPEPAPPGSPGGENYDGKRTEESGPHVLLSGRVKADSSLDIKIRIDVFDGDQRNRMGPKPTVVQFHEITGPGAFEISIPESATRVWLGAYADVNGNNRPNRGEPRGWFSGNPVFLNSPPDSIVIELVQEEGVSGMGEDFGQ